MSSHPPRPTAGEGEEQRLRALHSYRILDTAADPRFDRLTRMASSLLGVPTALITLIDDRRQWFKSRIGLALPETAREIAFCAHTLHGNEVMVVRDARQDPRFQNNPLVTGDPDVRFYAGAPLITGEGHHLGTFAILDSQPRDLNPEQKRMLQEFAALAADELELWRHIVEVDEAHAVQLAQAERRVREAERLEAMGRLAGEIAHDFNNLLTVILSTAAFAMQELPQSSPLWSEFRQIHAAGERGAMLTRQVLTFARRQSLVPAPIDVNALVESLLPMLRQLVGEGVELVFEADPGAGRINADSAQIDQVLMNLCANARDALASSGDGPRQIRLRTGTTTLEEITAGVHRVKPGPFVTITVEDTAGGMPADVLDRAFEPYFTTKGTRGAGLGLAIVHGIVRQHGGFIEIDSTLGKGTSVRLALPRTQERAAMVPRTMRPASRAGNETILLAEDNDLVRAVASRILREAGYRVLEAADGREALALFEREPDIALVVLDALMPGMGGPAALEAIRFRRPGTPYLLTSGHAGELARSESDDAHWLAKPYEPATLLRRVGEALCRPGG